MLWCRKHGKIERTVDVRGGPSVCKECFVDMVSKHCEEPREIPDGVVPTAVRFCGQTVMLESTGNASIDLVNCRRLEGKLMDF